MEKNAISLIDYADIILELCENILQIKPEELQRQWGIERKVSKLIISLYDETTNSTNSSNDSTTNDVFYNKEETGNTKYSENQLDNVSIEINGITEDISKHIKNQSEFIKAIKEYIYKNGLVDATAMEVQKYEYQENTDRLGIIFVLNNTNENKLRVIVNANGKIDISDYN